MVRASVSPLCGSGVPGAATEPLFNSYFIRHAFADLKSRAHRLPTVRWIADFTYIWTAEGWLYVEGRMCGAPDVAVAHHLMLLIVRFVLLVKALQRVALAWVGGVF